MERKPGENQYQHLHFQEPRYPDKPTDNIGFH